MNIKLILGVVVVVVVAVFAFNSWKAEAPENADTESETSAAPTEKKTASVPKASGGTGVTPPAPTTVPAATAESSRFCPKFRATIQWGSTDGAVAAGTRGDVSNLQVFLAAEYGLGSGYVNGKFDSDTETYLKRYQREQGLPQSGAVDSETMRTMLEACTVGVKANGVEYAKKSFSVPVGGVTETLTVHEAMQSGPGSLESGAYRIELISAGSSAYLRVTGPVIGGVQTDRFSLVEGGEKTTSHSPALLIKAVDVSEWNAKLSISK